MANKKTAKSERTGDMGADYLAGFLEIKGMNGKKISKKDWEKLKAIYLFENKI